MNVGDERTQSLWMDVEAAPRTPALSKDIDADTVVIGSGIAGLSVAYELAAIGRPVVVLDRAAIGSGMTARTTAHLTPICDDTISAMIKLRGEETSRLFYESQAAAVDRIEAIVRQESIACNFRRLDGYLFPALGTEPADAKEQLDTELEAGRKVGVKVHTRPGYRLRGRATCAACAIPSRRRSIR